MSGAIVDSLFWIASGEQPVDKSGSEAVATSDTVKNFQVCAISRLVELAVIQQRADQSLTVALFTPRSVVAVAQKLGYSATACSIIRR